MPIFSTTKKRAEATSSPKRGRFTFLEVMLVLTVIGFVFGIGVMQMGALVPEFRLKKQIRTLADTMDLAFTQSVVEGKSLSLLLDREKSEMRIEYYVEPEDEGDLWATEVEEEEEVEEYMLKPLLVEPFESGMELVEFEVLTGELEGPDREAILFRPEGSSDGAKVKFREKHTRLSQSLELWPLTGRIEISRIQASEF